MSYNKVQRVAALYLERATNSGIAFTRKDLQEHCKKFGYLMTPTRSGDVAKVLQDFIWAEQIKQRKNGSYISAV